MSEVTVLLEEDMVVGVDGDTMRIIQPESNQKRIPFKKINSVIIVGTPMVSGKVLQKLARHRITTLLLPLCSAEETRRNVESPLHFLSIKTVLTV